MKKVCCLVFLVSCCLNAMEQELQVKETRITVDGSPQEEKFGDFQDKAQSDPLHIVQGGDSVLDMMKRYGVESLPSDLVTQINMKLRKGDNDPLLLVTKGRRKKVDPTQILIKNLGKYVNTQEANLKLQNEKLKEEKQDREKAEKQKWCLTISNIVSWGANCSVGTLTLAGTIAAVVLTVSQAIKG